MRVAIFSIAFIFINANFVRAVPTLQSLQDHFRSEKVARGDFIQVRELKLLSKPLESRGKFLLARDRGLLWEQEYPFAQRIIVTDRIFRTEMAGSAPVDVTAADNPIAFSVSQVFLGIFSGDESKFKEYFSITFQSLDDVRWQLQLKPIRSPLNNIISDVRLTGGAEVSEIGIVYKGGDRTRISLNNLHFVPESLSDEEELAFRP